MFGNIKKLKKAADVCSIIVDCPHSTPKYDGNDRIYPCIRTSEIRNGIISWNSMKYVSVDEYNMRTKRLCPKAGDIIYAREGSYGDCVIVPSNISMCLGQRTMLFRPDYTICNSVYLHCALRSDDVKQQADYLNAGSTVPHVNVADAKNFMIKVPSLDRQNQFAYFVEQVDKSKYRGEESLRFLAICYKKEMNMI